MFAKQKQTERSTTHYLRVRAHACASVRGDGRYGVIYIILSPKRLYICICIYIYNLYTHTHTHIHTHTHTHTYTYISCICIYIEKREKYHTYIYHTHTDTHTHTISYHIKILAKGIRSTFALKGRQPAGQNSSSTNQIAFLPGNLSQNRYPVIFGGGSAPVSPCFRFSLIQLSCLVCLFTLDSTEEAQDIPTPTAPSQPVCMSGGKGSRLCRCLHKLLRLYACKRMLENVRVCACLSTWAQRAPRPSDYAIIDNTWPRPDIWEPKGNAHTCARVSRAPLTFSTLGSSGKVCARMLTCTRACVHVGAVKT